MPSGKYIRTEEIRNKISKANTGKEFTEEHCKNISKSHIGKPSSMLGKHHRKESKEKISNSEKGKIISEETKENIRLAVIKVMEEKRGSAFKNTLPERLVKEELELRSIPFVQSKYIKAGRVVVDFFIEPNIVIECDGDYWHNLPGSKEKDADRTYCMKMAGYEVYRFWEHEIKNNVKDCINYIDLSEVRENAK